jgi:hypothetical protein
VNLDRASAISQGEELARQTLELASQYREADSCALTLVADAAYAAKQGSDPDLSFVAEWFIGWILVAAVHGRNRL